LENFMGKLREPREFERHLFQNIYIDESSQTGARFLGIGGIVITREYAARFEEAIINARGKRLPLVHRDGKPREIGWSSCKRGDYESYKAVVDAFFEFKKGMAPSSFHSCKFHCSVADTHVIGRSYATGEKGQRGFEREIYYHCLLLARSYYDQNLFHIYPDDRSWKTAPRDLSLIMNRGIKRQGDKRDYPFRRFLPCSSHEIQALQVSDILLGALMYRFNGRYDGPQATPDKRMLSDYILTRARALPEIKKRGVKSHNWGDYTFHIRKHPEVRAGPARPHPARPAHWRGVGSQLKR
jgi:hypothetical protein